MSGMTGPLDVLFDQVREALAIGWPEGDHAEPNVFTDALAALSSIERHVQDMESLIEMASDPDRWDEFLAALSAREKEEE